MQETHELDESKRKDNAQLRLEKAIQEKVVEASALDRMKHDLYKRLTDQLEIANTPFEKDSKRDATVKLLAQGWFDLYASDLKIIGGTFNAANLKSAAEYLYDNHPSENNNSTAKMILMIMLGYPYRNDYLVEEM